MLRFIFYFFGDVVASTSAFVALWSVSICVYIQAKWNRYWEKREERNKQCQREYNIVWSILGPPGAPLEYQLNIYCICVCVCVHVWQARGSPGVETVSEASCGPQQGVRAFFDINNVAGPPPAQKRIIIAIVLRFDRTSLSTIFLLQQSIFFFVFTFITFW